MDFKKGDKVVINNKGKNYIRSTMNVEDVPSCGVIKMLLHSGYYMVAVKVDPIYEQFALHISEMDKSFKAICKDILEEV